MEKRGASILLMMLSLEALLLVAGLSAAAASSSDMDIIRLPSSDTKLGAGSADKAIAAMARSGGEERPWKCCDLQLCTKSLPPVCVCRDTFEQCSDACKNCEQAEEDPARYVCKDWYRGEPAPRCKDQGNKIAHHSTEAVGVVRGAKKKNSQERPWKCCDRAVPGPTTEGTVWYCMDKMKKCTCERCLEVEDGGHHYFCLDGYEGRDPGPSCTHDG